MGIKISKDHLHPSVIESITSLIGDLDQLETTAKGNAVEAINELLANGGNKEELEALIAEIAEGKEIIASAIGEPLSATDTFTAMGKEIEELLEYFRDKLKSIGVTDSLDNLKLKELIDKVKGPTKYSITKNLTNCTINNDATIIEENESYEATITVDSNYIKESMIVTMGGIDITKDVVTGFDVNIYDIYIASVTGDIVITVNAVVDNPYPPGTNVNNTVTSFSAYQYNPVTKSIPVEADGNYTLSFSYGPNISNQGYTASVTVRVADDKGSTVTSDNKSTQTSGSFSKKLTLKKGYTIQITASISATTHSSHCNQVSGIKLVFNSI